jgi:myosin heavy subunit
MFMIGGITALKQHDFFSGLDWIKLGNLELAAPIDLKKTNYGTSLPPNAAAAAQNKMNLKATLASATPGRSVITTPVTTRPSSKIVPLSETSPIPASSPLEEIKHDGGSEHQDQHENESGENKLNGKSVTPVSVGSSSVVSPLPSMSTSAKKQQYQKLNSQRVAEGEEAGNGNDDNGDDDEDDFTKSLKYFDKDFTSQVLSRSLVEDTYTPSNSNTASHTPQRSLSPPPFPLGIAEREGKAKASEDERREEEAYHGFDYVDDSIAYSKEQIEEFERLFELKQQKLAKKNKLKQKKDEMKAIQELEKQKVMEEQTRQQQDEMRKKEEKLKQQQKLLQLTERNNERQRAKSVLSKEKEVLLSQRQTSQELLQSNQKKSKLLKKKLRDIEEIKEKAIKDKKAINKDQEEKIKKQRELEKELEEILKEEEELIGKYNTIEEQWKACEEKEKELLSKLSTEEENDEKERGHILNLSSSSTSSTSSSSSSSSSLPEKSVTSEVFDVKEKSSGEKPTSRPSSMSASMITSPSVTSAVKKAWCSTVGAGGVGNTSNPSSAGNSVNYKNSSSEKQVAPLPVLSAAKDVSSVNNKTAVADEWETVPVSSKKSSCKNNSNSSAKINNNKKK